MLNGNFTTRIVIPQDLQTTAIDLSASEKLRIEAGRIYAYALEIQRFAQFLAACPPNHIFLTQRATGCPISEYLSNHFIEAIAFLEFCHVYHKANIFTFPLPQWAQTFSRVLMPYSEVTALAALTTLKSIHTNMEMTQCLKTEERRSLAISPS